jgi:hypothetical protein
MESLKKQRRLDRFPEIPVRDWDFGSTWQLLIRAYCSLIQITLGSGAKVRYRGSG